MHTAEVESLGDFDPFQVPIFGYFPLLAPDVSLVFNLDLHLPGHPGVTEFASIDNWGYFMPDRLQDARSGLIKNIVSRTIGIVLVNTSDF